MPGKQPGTIEVDLSNVTGTVTGVSGAKRAWHFAVHLFAHTHETSAKGRSVFGRSTENRPPSHNRLAHNRVHRGEVPALPCSALSLAALDSPRTPL